MLNRKFLSRLIGINCIAFTQINASTHEEPTINATPNHTEVVQGGTQPDSVSNSQNSNKPSSNSPHHVSIITLKKVSSNPTEASEPNHSDHSTTATAPHHGEKIITLMKSS